jgi:glyoxylase-like metal-dependent hydrolase (beta-lactamase superfamily II)
MSDLNVAIMPVTPLQQNCSLWWCTATNKAAVVDPGGDIDRILEVIEKQGVEVQKILITHGHLDHAGGTAELAERLHVPIEGPHTDDLFLIEALGEQGARFGINARPFETGRWLNGGDTVKLGALTLGVRHCPGHTPGHVIFFHQESKVAAVGDVLFRGSVGRTDLPRGDHNQLINSIRNELWPLGDDMRFVPGHGPISTFGQERLDNPFVADQLFA